VSGISLKFKVECSTDGAPGIDGTKEQGLRISLKWPDTEVIYIDLLLQGQIDKTPEDKRREDKGGKNRSGSSGTRTLGWDTPDVANAIARAVSRMTYDLGGDELALGFKSKDRVIPSHRARGIAVSHDGKGPGLATGTLYVEDAEELDISCSAQKFRVSSILLLGDEKEDPPGPATGVTQHPPGKGGPPFYPINFDEVPFYNGTKRKRPEGGSPRDWEIKSLPLPPPQRNLLLLPRSQPMLTSQGVPLVAIVMTPRPVGMDAYGDKTVQSARIPGREFGRLMLNYYPTEAYDGPFPAAGWVVSTLFEIVRESCDAQSREIQRCLSGVGVPSEVNGNVVVLGSRPGARSHLLSVGVELGIDSNGLKHSFPWSLALWNLHSKVGRESGMTARGQSSELLRVLQVHSALTATGSLE
jgi:hypothetical protein